MARDGRVLLERLAARMEMKSVLAAEEGERDLTWFDYSAPQAITSDGKQLLFYESGEGGGRGTACTCAAWTAACRAAG